MILNMLSVLFINQSHLFIVMTKNILGIFNLVH
jgi:hypothetical protein